MCCTVHGHVVAQENNDSLDNVSTCGIPEKQSTWIFFGVFE